MGRESKNRFVRLLKRVAQWILLPVFVLSASIGIVVTGWNYYEEYRDRDLAIAKTWPSNQLPFGSDVILKTSWRRGLLHYQFSVTPVSDIFMEKFQKRKNSDRANFFLEFEDSSGFRLGKLQISLESMTRVVDEKGNLHTMEVKDSTLFERDAYANSSRLSVAWSDVFDEIAKELKREKTSQTYLKFLE
jgi:hypothetical protein